MSLQRLDVRLQNPNAIFESWLELWILKAENKGCKSQHKLREALYALKMYPLPLNSGGDCAILRGFGTKLCNLIDNEIRNQKLDARTTSANIYETDVYQVVLSFQKDQKTETIPEEKTNKLTKKQVKDLAKMKEGLRQVKMSPGTFNIVLLVDTQETNGKYKRTLDHTRGYLESLKVEYEVRRLTIGDFIWVARDQENNELVLPYIVERKRMDDLASSIRDGRFHEQKHRLKHSGLQHIIYLIEDYCENEHLGLPLDNLCQSLINTLIHDKFSVEFTENHRRSIIYLQQFSIMLIRIYKNKFLLSCEKENVKVIDPTQNMVGLLKFKTLYEDSSRNAQFSIREIFVQQLLQLHSLSLEKTLSIVSVYPTPRCLLDAYEKCDSVNEERNMLAYIKFGQRERMLGKKISQIVHNFYRSEF